MRFSCIESIVVGYCYYRIRHGIDTVELISILLPFTIRISVVFDRKLNSRSNEHKMLKSAFIKRGPIHSSLKVIAFFPLSYFHNLSIKILANRTGVQWGRRGGQGAQTFSSLLNRNCFLCF